MPGLASAFYRVCVASAVLLPVRAARGGEWLRGATFWLAVLAGVFFAIDVGFFNSAVILTSAANATLLGNNSPLLVALGAWILFKHRPGGRFWVGLALALVGSTTIMGGDALRHASFGWGDVMAVLASVFFAAYILTTNRVRTTADTLTQTTVAVAASAATLFLICIAGHVRLTGYPLPSWAAVIALGLISQIIGYLAVTYALGHLPATVTSVGLLGQAPITALLAVPILGERLSMPQIIGGVLVLVGIYVVNRASD